MSATRTMFDGIYPDQVPAGAAIYAGYVDGDWQSYEGLVADRPGALHVSICVTSSGSARVLDVESGDASPAEAPPWATRQRAGGNPYPVVYMSESAWPAVKAAFADQDVAAPLYWVAAYVDDPSDVPAIPAGAIALQYYDYGGYDASVVADYWPGLDPAPEEETMEWTDVITGLGDRPDGNQVNYILTDLGRLRDRLFGDTTVAVPAGSPLAQLLAFLGSASTELTEVAGVVQDVGKLAQPVVDATELADELAGNAAFVSAIAAAVVAQIGADLKPATE